MRVSAASRLFPFLMAAGALLSACDPYPSFSSYVRNDPGTEDLQNPAHRMTICNGAPIPDGWIMYDYIPASTTECGGAQDHPAKVTRVRLYQGLPVGLAISVCPNAPTPDGWDTIEVVESVGHLCGGSIKVIQRAR